MSEKKQGCTDRIRKVTHADLPLSCPAGDERVWDVHPRVYLAIETLGEVMCPYCGTHYILDNRSS